VKKVIILLLALCLYSSLFADDKLSKSSLSLNLGGPYAFATFDYQQQLFSSNKHTLFASTGLGMAGSTVSFPVGINYAFGSAVIFPWAGIGFGAYL